MRWNDGFGIPDFAFGSGLFKRSFVFDRRVVAGTSFDDDRSPTEKDGQFFRIGLQKGGQVVSDLVGLVAFGNSLKDDTEASLVRG